MRDSLPQQMLPGDAPADAVHRSLGNAKHISHSAISQARHPDPHHVGGRKLSLDSALARSLHHVLLLASCPQMQGLYANGSITGMQNKLPRQDRAVENNMRDSVGVVRDYLGTNLGAEISVPCRSFAGRPVPAPFSGWLFRKKPEEGLFGCHSGWLLRKSHGLKSIRRENAR